MSGRDPVRRDSRWSFKAVTNPILVPRLKTNAASDRDLLITPRSDSGGGLTYLSIEQPQEGKRSCRSLKKAAVTASRMK